MENGGFEPAVELAQNGHASPVARRSRVLSVSEDVEERRKEQRDREPLRLCKWITDRPKTWFFVLLASAWLFFFITAIMIVLGYDILPIVFERLPLDILDNKFYLRGLSWQHANEDDLIYERGSEGPAFQDPRSQTREMMTFVYEKDDGNVFTASNLRAIEKHENDFIGRSEYAEKFCLLEEGVCALPRSVIRLFDGTFQNASDILYDPMFQNISAVINEGMNNNYTKRLFEFMMPAEYTVNPDEPVKTSIIRSTVSIGWPLDGYDNDEDEEDDQLEKTEKFLGDYLPDAQDAYNDGVGQMDFYYFSGLIFQQFVTTQVYRDMGLLGGSLVFIFVVMCIQTRSLFITTFSVLSIVTSFFIANMIYRVAFDYRYFGIFHVLALFIILGIGADDVFVFYDTWRESGHYHFKSLAHRLSFVYKRAAKAMLWTSLTTTIAFVVSAFSPFLGVNTFGVFAGLLVVVNYLSVITFLPCVIIIYHIYFEKFCCCCCCPNKTAPEFEDEKPEQKGILVRFFHNTYFSIITHKIGRWIIVVFFLALLGTFIYFATGLEPQEDQVRHRLIIIV